MTAEEIKELDAKMRRAIGTYDTGLVINIAESVTKVAVEFAESLAKERAVEFVIENTDYHTREYYEKAYDDYFAEKRKEGAE